MIDWIALAVRAALGVTTPAVADLSNALTAEGCEYGEVYAGTPAECELTLSNAGDTPIRVSDFRLLNGDGVNAPSALTVAPLSTVRVPVGVDTAKNVGKNGFIVRFDTDPPTVVRSAKVKGYVLTALDQVSPVVDLGVVDLTATAAPREYALTSHEVADFRINGVVQAPTWLDVTLAQPHVLSVSVKPGASWGLHEDYIRVALNTPRQHEALIKVKADVRGDVVPSANPLDLGIMRAGNRNEALVRLNSRSQKAFKLGKIAVEGFNARTEVLPCRPKADGCKLVRVVVGKDQPAGSFRGTLHVELPELRTQLPVSIWGFLVPKDYKIRDVTPDPGQSKATAPASLHDELKASTQVKKSEQAPPPGDGPLLKWTASSLDTVYGFQIFRADSEQGPFLLINPKPVLADMNDENPQTFQWRDNDVRHGATYYYSIGILRVDGKKEHLAGPQKVVAK